MKSLRSCVTIKSPTKKRTQLPSLRTKKTAGKPSELFQDCSSAVIIHSSILPLEIILEKQREKAIVISISHLQARVLNTRISIPLNLKAKQRKWIEINFANREARVRLSKRNDQNFWDKTAVFGSIAEWQRHNPKENSKSVLRLDFQNLAQMEQQKKIKVEEQSDKNQIRNFITFQMNRKLTRKSINSEQRGTAIIIARPHYQQTSLMKGTAYSSKQSLDGPVNILQRESLEVNAIKRLPLSRVSRMQLKSNLRESIFTGKSQKETSVGGGRSILNNFRDEEDKAHNHSKWTMDLDQEQYSRRLKKFDTTILISTKLSNLDLADKTKKQSISNFAIQRKQAMPNRNSESEKESNQQEEGVAEEISVERSKLVKRKADQQTFNSQFEEALDIKPKKQQQSSSLCESYVEKSREAAQESGSLYQSRYQ